MRSRDVVGRKIVRVDHERFYNDHLGRLETVVERIVLDDGSVLYPEAFETGDIAQGNILHVKKEASA